MVGVASDFDLVRELEARADQGLCINLVNDDDGHWAFTADGFQNIRHGGDYFGEVLITAERFKPSILEAWQAFLDSK